LEKPIKNNSRAKVSLKINKMTKNYPKKIHLGVKNRQTKWAPFWAVIRKYGPGKSKRIHPSQITANRRHWRRTKLKIKPRRVKKQHLG